MTDPGFAKRIKDLIAHDALNLDDVRLLKYGRHFRLGEDTKLVVGRHEADNTALEALIRPKDIVFTLKDHQGPLSILRGSSDKRLIDLAAKIVAHHTKFRDEGALAVKYWPAGTAEITVISIKPAAQDEIEDLRI